MDDGAKTPCLSCDESIISDLLTTIIPFLFLWFAEGSSAAHRFYTVDDTSRSSLFYSHFHRGLSIYYNNHNV